MVDHRIPHDFNYSINSSSITNYFVRAKLAKLKGDIIHHFGFYYSLFGIVYLKKYRLLEFLLLLLMHI